MEVHQHTHSSGKKWTHYLWEFVMLFLAVFCGFLAEYQLEHKIEKEKEKVYIRSMIEDLATDTANINTHFSYRTERQRRLDSLSLLLQLPDFKKYSGDIYYYSRWALRTYYFNSNDRTIQQLKNSGGMRLITRAAASSAITNYDAQVKIVNTQSYALENENVTQFGHLMRPIFDGNVMDAIYADSLLIRPACSPELLVTDKKAFNELIMELHYVKSINKRNIFFENKLKNQAIATIKLLKKEYHLE